MEYREFDPEEDVGAFKEGRLFELQSKRTDDKVVAKLVKVTTESGFDEAVAVPWFFVVEVK